MASDLTTRELTRRIAAGNSAAICRFYEEFFDLMYREASRATRCDEHRCLDIVQESMLKVIRRVPALESRDELEAWTRKVVRNVGYDLLRSEIRRKERELRSNRHREGEYGEQHRTELEAMQDQASWLSAELQKLDSSEAGLLSARYSVGLTLREISEKNGLSVSAVDGKIRRLVSKLRRLYWGRSNDGTE